MARVGSLFHFVVAYRCATTIIILFIVFFCWAQWLFNNSCIVRVARAIYPMVRTGRILQVAKKIGHYSISFVGARSLEVVGGCVVATLGVQQLYR